MKAGHSLKHFVVWCDRCVGQLLKNFTLRVINEFFDPFSPYYIEVLVCLDVRRATKGHSYLWCDRIIPPIKKKAKQYPQILTALHDARLDELLPK